MDHLAGFQSQTGSPSSSDSDLWGGMAYYSVWFQSQTGSPSSSDRVVFPAGNLPVASFNPKREAHPLQTVERAKVQCSDILVSIPNGKPILFRRGEQERCHKKQLCFNPKREAHPLQTLLCLRLAAIVQEFQSQTGSPSSSDHRRKRRWKVSLLCFNPKREAHPLQTAAYPLWLAAWNNV